jgi:hypothetical protein
LAQLVIEAGVLEAQRVGVSCRFMVITSPAEGMSTSRLGQGWNRLAAALRRSGELYQYACVIEFAQGRPHLNIIGVGGRAIPKPRLARLAERAGFGRHTWIRSVGQQK